MWVWRREEGRGSYLSSPKLVTSFLRFAFAPLLSQVRFLCFFSFSIFLFSLFFWEGIEFGGGGNAPLPFTQTKLIGGILKFFPPGHLRDANWPMSSTFCSVQRM